MTFSLIPTYYGFFVPELSFFSLGSAGLWSFISEGILILFPLSFLTSYSFFLLLDFPFLSFSGLLSSTFLRASWLVIFYSFAVSPLVFFLFYFLSFASSNNRFLRTPGSLVYSFFSFEFLVPFLSFAF